MTKQEFLSRLCARLEVLSKKERDDIIEEYSQHIDMKVESGMKEEDAINDFGDVDALADEILEAYNLNTDYVKDREKHKPFEKRVADKVSGFADTVSSIADSISKKSGKQILSIIVKFVILVIILLLLRIPVNVLVGLSITLFAFLPGYMEAVITGIISVLINLIYLAVVCYSIYYFFKRIANEDYDVSDDINAFAKGVADESISDDKNDNDWDNEDLREDTKKKTEKKESKNNGFHGFTWEKRKSDKNESQDFSYKDNRRENRKKRNDGSIAHTLGSIVGIILKIIVIIFMIPVIAFGLCLVAGLGVSLALLIKGFAVFGIMLIALGASLCLMAFVWAVFKAIFGKKNTPAPSAASASASSHTDNASDNGEV